jgi:hypothetical protein
MEPSLRGPMFASTNSHRSRTLGKMDTRNSFKAEMEEFDSGSQKALGIEIHRFAGRLKKLFSAEIAKNDVRFKKLVVKLLRKALPPRPGRRNDPRINFAIHLLQQGKTLREVLQIQIPDFESMDSYARILADRGLRKSLAARGFRFRKKTGAPSRASRKGLSPQFSKEHSNKCPEEQ